MNIGRTIFLVIPACFAATACVMQPVGPAVAVKPAPGKPFIVFQQDDAACRQYAGRRLAAETGEANNVQAGGQPKLNIQQRYDLAYLQCMQARGHEVPGFKAPQNQPPGSSRDDSRCDGECRNPQAGGGDASPWSRALAALGDIACRQESPLRNQPRKSISQTRIVYICVTGLYISPWNGMTSPTDDGQGTAPQARPSPSPAMRRHRHVLGCVPAAHEFP